ECCGAGVFDSRDGYPIFFGGVEPTGASAFVALNTTWSFRNSSWTVLPTPAAPPARYYYGLVDDPADGYVLLYGGEWGDCSTGSCGLYSDTWRFSGGNWTKLSPAQSPGQRLGFAMDYDAALGGVLLYGGLSSSGSVLNDTWEFSGGSWTQLHGATSPPPLEFARMAYDAADNATILFGGKNTAGNFGETWSFADSTWTQLSVGWAPSWRWGETLVYDGETNFLLLYGGITNGSSDADAWGYSDGFWTDLPRTPSPVAGAMQEALYDPQLGQVLMFGGLGTTYTSDLWFWTYAGRFVIQEEALGRDATDIGQTVVGTAWVEGGRANVSLSWSGLPPGCGRTDLLTVYCRPTATGTYAIAVQAADAVGSVATAGPVNLTVVADPIASTPVANRSSLDVGQSVSFRETATLGSGGYTYDWLVLPTGCSGITALVRCSPTGAGVFNVTVEVTDANGFSSVAPTLAVTVYDDPSLVSFSANRTSADAGQSTNFTTNVTAGSGGYLYLWSGLPTGCNGLGPSAICSDQLPGVYVVSVTITDSNGFTIRTNVLPFTIYPDPVVGVPVASQPSADINQSVTFTGNPQFGSGGYVYAWIGLPTGCLGTTQRVMCTIEAAGSFLVAVRVVDSNGYSVTSASVAFVALGDPVVAGPVASPPSVDVGESVTFSATPSGGSGGYTLAWNDLPPPCSPTAVSPSCVAGAPGTYAVSVTVNDTNGYRVVGGPIAFHVSELPTVAAPLPSTRSVDAGQNVSFRVSFTPGSGGDRFQWLDLPSGCNATGPLANCTDPGAGSYHVGARVTDSNGGTSVSPLTGFTVYSDPVATDLRANRSSADVSQPVTLTASATSGSGNFTYAWAGLPTTCGGSASQLRCAFAEPGVYGITVQATDSNGVSTSVIGLNFTVDPLPALSGPTPSATVVDVGQSIHFTTTLTGGSGNESYNWTGLPPGCTPPDAAEWTCTPTRAGTWTIGLTARDSNGAQSTGASFTLVVHPAVEISAIGATPSSILAGATVLFSAAVDGGTSPYTYSWTGLPAGCTARNAAEISCQPTASGTFRVGLTVRDAAGETVYTNVTVTVAPSLFGLPVDEAYALILGGALAVAALGAAAFWRRRRGRAAADAAEEETPPPEEPPAGPEEPPEAEGPVEEGGAGGTASDEEPAPGDVGGLESPGSDGA
ncbi:MAG TPA: kelch repeat-containing protein, partial [Thermoplasmata archaeon]|nr:kelch repeat-containing protein [Thermoplasmata archaeon]